MRLIEGDARIALDVDHLGDFDARIFFEYIFVAVHAFFQVDLVGHGEYNDVALAVELLGHDLPAQLARLIVVGADKEQAIAVRRVGVDGEHRNSGGNRGIDLRLHHFRIGGRNQDA